MNSAAPHPTERHKEAGGSSLPLHFEHWTRAMATGTAGGYEEPMGSPEESGAMCSY